MKNTNFRYCFQNSGFWYTCRNLTSEYYFLRYGPLISMMCYRYAFYPCFEEWMKINLYKTIYLQIKEEKLISLLRTSLITILNHFSNTKFILYRFFGELIIDYFKFPMIFLDFVPFRGIFGPSTQLLRPVASERLVHLCHFNVLKYSSGQHLFSGLLKV